MKTEKAQSKLLNYYRHPIFAPDDQSVFFNSDREGRSNLYQVLRIDDFKARF